MSVLSHILRARPEDNWVFAVLPAFVFVVTTCHAVSPRLRREWRWGRRGVRLSAAGNAFVLVLSAAWTVCLFAVAQRQNWAGFTVVWLLVPVTLLAAVMTKVRDWRRHRHRQ